MGSAINVVAHNLPGMFSARQLGITSKNKTKSTEKLASGYRINRAADDSSGLAISEKMRKQIRGLSQGIDNTHDGISFVQIADGAMAEVGDMLHRMEELSVKAANGTNSQSDREAINMEIQALKTEINRIGTTSKFNDQYIFEQSVAQPSFRLRGKYFTMDDINLYNSYYDSVTDQVKYGGIIFNGERISWDTIDPDMVSIDENGNQIFKAGTYSFAQNGVTFNISSGGGINNPHVTRSEEFSGNLEYMFVDGKRYRWSDFYDEMGEKLSYDTMHNGRWQLKDKSANIDLDVSYDSFNAADLGDIAEASRLGMIPDPTYYWSEAWDHAVKKKAVETTGETSADIVDETIAKKMLDNYSTNGQVEYRLRAGKVTGEGDLRDYIDKAEYTEQNGV